MSIYPAGGVIIKMKKLQKQNSSNNIDFWLIEFPLSDFCRVQRLLQLICDYAFDPNCRAATEAAIAGDFCWIYSSFLWVLLLLWISFGGRQLIN